MANAYERLRRRLEVQMANRGWSRSELSRRAGLSPSYVTQVLNGTNRSPGLEQIEALANGLGITVSQLLAGPEDGPSLKHCLREVREAMQILETADNLEVLKLLERLKRK